MIYEYRQSDVNRMQNTYERRIRSARDYCTRDFSLRWRGCFWYHRRTICVISRNHSAELNDTSISDFIETSGYQCFLYKKEKGKM